MTIHIRTLTPSELSAYRAHLLRLNREDRRLRFGYPIQDEAVCSFVARLDPTEDRVLAVFNDDLEVIGSVQVSFRDRKAIEFAFSVDPVARGAGLGRALFDRAILWARNRGFRGAHIFFLADNQVMRRMARALGMTVTLESGDCEGTMALPRATPFSMAREFALENLASLDYASKVQRQFRWSWLSPRTA